MITWKLMIMAVAATGMVVMLPATAEEKAATSPNAVFAVYYPESTQATAVTVAEINTFGLRRGFQRQESGRDRYLRDRGRRDLYGRPYGLYGRPYNFYGRPYERYIYRTDAYGRRWRYDRYTRQWTLLPGQVWRYERPYGGFGPIYGRPLTPRHREYGDHYGRGGQLREKGRQQGTRHQVNRGHKR